MKPEAELGECLDLGGGPGGNPEHALEITIGATSQSLADVQGNGDGSPLYLWSESEALRSRKPPGKAIRLVDELVGALEYPGLG